MHDWPIDRELDERLRQVVLDEVAAADPRQIAFRNRPARRGSLLGTGVAAAAVLVLVAALVWRSQSVPPVNSRSSDTPAVTPTAASASPYLSLATSATPTPTPTPQPTVTGAPARTLTPGFTPGPTADPAIAPVRNQECLGYLAVPLQDGRVLVAPGCSELAPTVIFDPRTRLFSASGPMTTEAAFSRTTATRMTDGRVLFAGGYPATGPRSVTIDEVFDPSTGRFTPIGPFTPMTYATSVLLSDGRVLIVGSNIDTPSATDSAEVFDPVSNTIAATGPMLSGGNPVGSSFSAVLLGNGKVLLADSPNAQTARTQIYDPTTNSFKATEQSRVVRDAAVFATALPDGRAMLFGGGNDVVEAYDPATDSFSRLASMPNAANVISFANLTDGRILAIGEDQRKSGWRSASGGWFDVRPAATSPVSGENATLPLNMAAEIYDPGKDQWTSLGDLEGQRFGSSVAALPGGGAIVVSGDTTVVELFDPKTGKFTLNQ